MLTAVFIRPGATKGRAITPAPSDAYSVINTNTIPDWSEGGGRVPRY